MAAAAGNGPLATHRRQLTPCRRVRSIGDDPPSKQIYFSLAIRGSKTLKMLGLLGEIKCHHPLIIGVFSGP
jgi:hypothetical protein